MKWNEMNSTEQNNTFRICRQAQNNKIAVKVIVEQDDDTNGGAWGDDGGGGGMAQRVCIENVLVIEWLVRSK